MEYEIEKIRSNISLDNTLLFSYIPILLIEEILDRLITDLHVLYGWYLDLKWRKTYNTLSFTINLRPNLRLIISEDMKIIWIESELHLWLIWFLYGSYMLQSCTLIFMKSWKIEKYLINNLERMVLFEFLMVLLWDICITILSILIIIYPNNLWIFA